MTERLMPAVKALIERDGRFLAISMDLEEKGEMWTLPGGRVEHGETPEEALQREVDEEVSLDVNVHQPVGTFHFFFDNGEKQVVLTVFRCTPDGGEIDVDSNPSRDEGERITDYEWVTPNEFLDREAEDTLKEVIKEHYNAEIPKLVRDRIPEFIEEDGETPIAEQVSNDEARRYLADKLVEEAEEFRESRDAEELADVLEVVRRCCEVAYLDLDELEEIREEKKLERGGFDDNIILRDVED